MQTFTCSNFSNLDSDTIRDFLDSFEEIAEDIEFSMQKLNKEATDTYLNQLTCSLHALKGNFNLCYLDPMVRIIDKIEQLIFDLRSGTESYTSGYGDLIISIINHLKDSVDMLLNQKVGNKLLIDKISLSLDTIISSTNYERQCNIDDATANLTNIDNDTYDEAQENSIDLPPTKTDEFSSVEKQVSLEPISFPSPLTESSMDFFQSLALQMDTITPNRKGRSEEELVICSSINEKMGLPIPPEQLKAAVLVHDLGMAYIPAGIISKSAMLNKKEFRQLRYHIYVGRSLLQHIPGWEEAEKIVWHHHEYYDGSGYPNGIKGEEIHLGARLIAVADTFCSTTRDRADRTFKHSLLKAVQEINTNINTQYDPEVVSIFNDTIKERFVKKRD